MMCVGGGNLASSPSSPGLRLPSLRIQHLLSSRGTAFLGAPLKSLGPVPPHVAPG